MSATTTSERLLDEAQRLVQTRGYNAFSYKDLAASVGIRTASIHYHYASKADLGKALIDRYVGGLNDALAGIERRHPQAHARLAEFVESYRQTEKKGLTCLCGSLASDLATLREDVQASVRAYLDGSTDWVQRQIELGRETGEFGGSGPDTARDLASLLVSGLQGALLLDRAAGSAGALDRVERTFFLALGAGTAARNT